MIVIKSPFDLNTLLDKSINQDKKIGFVATMGALHDGHISLIERSKRENDTTVCSIFVNPLQFNDPNDLNKYPRPIENDIKILTEVGTDILFLPSYEDIYPGSYDEPEINLYGLDTILEGAIRPGHFKGVASVVKRLFDCVKPDNAYFGQKDYQQTIVIKQIVKQFNLPINIIICEILREKNGLAMSSRNIQLTDEHRLSAGFIYSNLLQLKKDAATKPLIETMNNISTSIIKNKGVALEYVTVVDSQTLVPIEKTTNEQSAIALLAVNYYGVRLLDNIFL